MRQRSKALHAHAALLYAFLYAPIVVVIVCSFNTAARGAIWRGFTMEWYARLLDSPEKLAAMTNTLVLAGMSTLGSTVLGTLLGYGLNRYDFPAKRFVSWLLYVPLVVPDIVAAVALLMFCSFVRDWTGLLAPGLATMIVAHVTFQVPLIAIVVRSRLEGMDPAIEEAAHDLGADSRQRFWHVTLPMMWPGVLAGAALAFTLSLDDFVLSFFLSGPGSTTLPILIYSSVKRGITPDIHALAALIVLGSVAGSLAIAWLQRPDTDAKT